VRENSRKQKCTINELGPKLESLGALLFPGLLARQAAVAAVERVVAQAGRLHHGTVGLARVVGTFGWRFLLRFQ